LIYRVLFSTGKVESILYMSFAMTLVFSLVFTIISLGIVFLFIYESISEQESRATKVGFLIAIMLIGLGTAITYFPILRIPYAVCIGLAIFAGLLFCLPIKSKARSLKGAIGYVEGNVERFDQRDTVFSRNRVLKPGTENYEEYYRKYPEKEQPDAERRAKGGLLGKIGAIDNQHKTNVELIKLSPNLGGVFEPHAKGIQISDGAKSHLSFQNKNGSDERQEIDPNKATEILKGLAKRMGTCLVGTCKVDPKWAYSVNGEGNWGKETPKQLPYAIVFATEMRHDDVSTSPHTTAEVECSINYADGAYVSTALVCWIKGMNYEAMAQHNRSYELLMPPLGIDAGLGELGRFGYVITDKYGPRVRLFAVTTDMPLEIDKPVDIGAEAFCERCKKCATACPSRSIPQEGQTVVNGIRRWKLDDESCFAYWGRVGTGCSVCMAICPFSRPNRTIHKMIRWFLKRSDLATTIFPHIDNFAYGTKWHAKKPKETWNSYLNQ
jgi:reductive dehalogenase